MIKKNDVLNILGNPVKVLERNGDYCFCELTAKYDNSTTWDIGRIEIPAFTGVETISLLGMGTHIEGNDPSGVATPLSMQQVSTKYHDFISRLKREAENTALGRAKLADAENAKIEKGTKVRSLRDELVADLRTRVSGMDLKKAVKDAEVNRIAMQINTLDIILKYVKL